MARSSLNLLELDIDKLLEEHKVEEVVEVEKKLNIEIERKRVELRSMVGERYKDVLAASDAIKNMKAISETIVTNIQYIDSTCNKLINSSSIKFTKTPIVINKAQLEERALIIQLQLAILINEEIWIALDNINNLKAVELYLLSQHIYTGLSLADKKYLERLPILQQIKDILQTLRNEIFLRINQKLESVEITSKETSQNLNALMLLKNHSSNELLSIFIENRKSALKTVTSTIHSSVRIQISAMVQCLITTIHLLHDCFICFNGIKKGLIWQQLDDLIGEQSTSTLSKVHIPETSLIAYIPNILKEFVPKYRNINNDNIIDNNKIIEEWLNITKQAGEEVLKESLQLVTTVKGLYIIREEALKIQLPTNWEKICLEIDLPKNFNVWYYFFQHLITNRVKELISNKLIIINNSLQEDIKQILNKVNNSECDESDLRWYVWREDINDVSRTENKHIGLTMKTLGYSHSIVGLCDKVDRKFKELLIDISQYLYGCEFSNSLTVQHFAESEKNFIDRHILEIHLKNECINSSKSLIIFLQNIINKEDEGFVLKSILCARFLHALTSLCIHFNKCCSFNNKEEWNKICNEFDKYSIEFWRNWINMCVSNTEKMISNQLSDIKTKNMIEIMPRWDVIEIQEQTDDNVFKSQIKIPLKPTLILENILNKLNDDISHVLPLTLSKSIHIQFIEANVHIILIEYKKLVENDLNQNQSLQFLFDVKYLTTFCIPRENIYLVSISQEVCDKLRSKIDPFDLNVFYSHLQINVKKAALQAQMIFGCLLPMSNQLVNLGCLEKTKEQDKEPSILALSVPSTISWFPLLPVTVPSYKINPIMESSNKNFESKSMKTTTKKLQDSVTSTVKSGASSLFSGLTTDWFS